MADSVIKLSDTPIRSAEEMESAIGSAEVGTTFKIVTEVPFVYDYGSGNTITYYDGVYVIWNGEIMDIFGASYAELDKMYKKFQTWALKWFREEAQSAYIYFECFIGTGITSLNANTDYTDKLLTLSKESGDLDMDQNGVISFDSSYAQFKVNLDISFPGYASNTTLGNLTVTAVTKDKDNNEIRLSASKTIDHTIPKSSVSFDFDLRDKVSVKFIVSADKAQTAWSITSNVSLLGYRTGHDGE